MIDFSGISLPFSVGDMIRGGTELIAVVGAFLLLGLAIYFAPLIISFLYKAIGNKDASTRYRSYYYRKHYYFRKTLPLRLRGTLELQDSEGKPIRKWSSRNAKY